jgi:hypothetical protein
MSGKLSRATGNAQEWFQKLTLLFCASTGQNAYSHAAFFYKLATTADGDQNPFANMALYDECVENLATRNRNYPFSLPSSSKSKKEASAGAAAEDNLALLDLQEPFLIAAAKDAQLTWYNYIMSNLDQELTEILFNFIPIPMSCPNCGTKAMVHLLGICYTVSQQTVARDVALAISQAQEVAANPAATPAVITQLCTAYRRVGELTMTLPRLLTLLVCMGLTDAGPAMVNPTYLRLADEFIADDKKELTDLQREVSNKLGQNIPIVPAGRGSSKPSYTGATAGAAGRGAPAPAAKERPAAPAGCRYFRDHICCKLCGMRVGSQPAHSKQNCPVDTTHEKFSFGKNFPLKTANTPSANL